LRKISPKAYQYVRSCLSLGLPDVRTVRKHGGGGVVRSKIKKEVGKQKSKKFSGRQKQKPKSEQVGFISFNLDFEISNATKIITTSVSI
jgi:hypothetical protein